LLGVATAVVILGASVAPFLAPPAIRFEQDRAGAAALTGFSGAQLDTITGSLVGDLLLWQSDFRVAIDGVPVLNDAERSHMRDVRKVFAGFWLVVLAAAAVLAVGFGRAGVGEARAEAWRAIRNGARGLAVAVAVVGAFAIVAFDAAFELFHRLFFSAGNYTFDPRTNRLVQLYPEQFFSEIAIAVGVVVFGVAVLTAWYSGMRA
jgi:integral membrane protein (TIGR01906 family)